MPRNSADGTPRWRSLATQHSTLRAFSFSYQCRLAWRTDDIRPLFGAARLLVEELAELGTDGIGALVEPHYNEVRPHRAKGRKTPRSAFDSRAKARPTKPEGTFTRELRVRHDRIDRHGVVTIRYKSKLHHIGMGRALAGTRIVLLVAGRHIRVIHRDGQLLRDFELDPSRNYQPQSLG